MRYVILGGGVAGVACLEELLRAAPDADVTLVCAAPSVKAVANYLKISDVLESFDLEELPLAALAAARPNVKPVRGVATAVDAAARVVRLADGRALPYDRLCVAAGAVPRSVAACPLVVTLRDMLSMEQLAARLAGARRVVVLGNGGIALGLVHELRGCELVWAVRDGFIGGTFLDASASAFFLAEHAARLVLVPQPPPAEAAPAPAASAAHAFHEDGCCGGGGGGGGVAGASFNYHDDRPHPQLLAAACSDDERDDDDGELIPTYAPLPQRARRRPARRQPPAAAPGAAPPPPPPPPPPALCGGEQQQEPGGGVLLPSASADSAPPASAAAAAPAPAPAAAFGSSLGPGWVAALQQHLLDGGGSASSGGTSAGGDARVGGGARVLVETACELAALRGSGPADVVGAALADGAWHTVPELQRMGAPPPLAGDRPARPPGQQAVGGSSCGCSCAPPCGFPLHVRLTNGHEYGCDFVVSATGVVPVGAEGAAGAGGALALLPAGAFARSPADGGLIVNSRMQTTGSPDVFAAGDAASVTWPQRLVRRTAAGALPLADPGVCVPLWFQMRLWNQARQQGVLAARWMCGSVDPLEAEDGGLAFELFAHATRLLGRPVALLGLFNGQGLGPAYETALRAQVVVSADGLQRAPGAGGSGGGGRRAGRPPGAAATVLSASHLDHAAPPAEGGGSAEGSGCSAVQVQLRVTPGVEYVKLVLLHSRIVGALLIGDTGLGETMENLILNRIPVTGATGGGGGGGGGGGPQLLDLLHPDVDIEDYFD